MWLREGVLTVSQHAVPSMSATHISSAPERRPAPPRRRQARWVSPRRPAQAPGLRGARGVGGGGGGRGHSPRTQPPPSLQPQSGSKRTAAAAHLRALLQARLRPSGGRHVGCYRAGLRRRQGPMWLCVGGGGSGHSPRTQPPPPLQPQSGSKHTAAAAHRRAVLPHAGTGAVIRRGRAGLRGRLGLL